MIRDVGEPTATWFDTEVMLKGIAYAVLVTGMVCCVVKINEPIGFCREAPPVKPNNDENTLSN